MRGLPGWMILVLAVLSGAILYVGIEERHHIGPLPILLGVLWTLFTLAAIAAKARPEAH